jgi:hypothetical protein
MFMDEFHTRYGGGKNGEDGGLFVVFEICTDTPEFLRCLSFRVLDVCWKPGNFEGNDGVRVGKRFWWDLYLY